MGFEHKIEGPSFLQFLYWISLVMLVLRMLSMRRLARRSQEKFKNWGRRIERHDLYNLEFSPVETISIRTLTCLPWK